MRSKRKKQQQRQIKKEQIALFHQEQQISEWIKRKVERIFGVSANPDYTTRHNAANMLKDMPA
eukprot:812209-Ditylum_brightwellii.AAC.1